MPSLDKPVSGAPINELHLPLPLYDTQLIVRAFLLVSQIVCTVSHVVRYHIGLPTERVPEISSSDIYRDLTPKIPMEFTTNRVRTTRAMRSNLTTALRNPELVLDRSTADVGAKTRHSRQRCWKPLLRQIRRQNRHLWIA